MSEISVNRTVGDGRCLIIDGTRVAGGKPEFSDNNCIYWWQTNETIGVVDDINAENERLRELVRQMYTCPTCGNLVFPPNSSADNTELISLVRDMYTCIEHADDVNGCAGCPLDDTGDCDFEGRMMALGII